MGIMIRFERGQEDRTSVEVGPFDYVQMTYSMLTASPAGEIRLADCVDGWWVTLDGQRWSDFMVYEQENENA